MDSLTLYHVGQLPGIGTPLLITTLTEARPGEWTGEMYLLLEDDDRSVLQATFPTMRVTGNARPHDDASEQAILKQELLIQADRRLGLYRQDHGHIEGAHLSRMQVAQTNRNALVNFWTQSPSGGNLVAIRGQTKSPALREELDLVMSQPTLRSKPSV